jgi:hypothetical protein
MAAFDECLATDEDVAIKAAGDFATLIPAHQRAAYGTDGTLSNWTLSTAANLTGLGAGHVVHVGRSGNAWHDLLAYQSKSGGDLTLRRVGMDSGYGPPPSPPAGTVLVTFWAPTALPQIKAVTASILRRFGFADYAAIGSALDGAGDPEHFRPLATISVLIDLLGTQHRAGSSEENFHTKYKDLLAERETLAADLIDDYGRNANRLRAGVLRLPTYRTANTSEF